MQLDLLSIQSAAMGLPVEERVQLAEALWDSIDETEVASDPAALAEAKRRDDEMSSGKVTGRSHDEVMRALRKATSMRLTYHPEAEEELAEAARYYAARGPTRRDRSSRGTDCRAPYSVLVASR